MKLPIVTSFKHKRRYTVLAMTDVILQSGFILAQNDDGPLKWANGPYPIQIHANFQILMSNLNFLWALCKI